MIMATFHHQQAELSGRGRAVGQLEDNWMPLHEDDSRARFSRARGRMWPK